MALHPSYGLLEHGTARRVWVLLLSQGFLAYLVVSSVPKSDTRGRIKKVFKMHAPFWPVYLLRGLEKPAPKKPGTTQCDSASAKLAVKPLDTCIVRRTREHHLKCRRGRNFGSTPHVLGRWLIGLNFGVRSDRDDLRKNRNDKKVLRVPGILGILMTISTPATPLRDPTDLPAQFAANNNRGWIVDDGKQ
ncbi:hypothetical protein C8R47DRAFT_1064039 [Mycena vitilis]|nr:hypothetical protein C8R47DRAFT_1064039 [Mycena vitilis]